MMAWYLGGLCGGFCRPKPEHSTVFFLLKSVCVMGAVGLCKGQWRNISVPSSLPIIFPFLRVQSISFFFMKKIL